MAVAVAVVEAVAVAVAVVEATVAVTVAAASTRRGADSETGARAVSHCGRIIIYKLVKTDLNLRKSITHHAGGMSTQRLNSELSPNQLAPPPLSCRSRLLHKIGARHNSRDVRGGEDCASALSLSL